MQQEPDGQQEPGAGGYLLIVAFMLLVAVIAVLVLDRTGQTTIFTSPNSNL